MKESASNRHEGDLGGRLLPFGETNQVEVAVAVDPTLAGQASIQHAAWMLLNLLARQQGVIRSIHLACPTNVPLAGRIVPLVSRHIDLRSALLEGCQAVGVVPIDDRVVSHWTVAVGAGTGGRPPANLYVYGNGWCGGFSTTPLPQESLESASEFPFGPYVGACMAAGEIFKAARMKPEEHTVVDAAYYSLWRNRASPAPNFDGPKRFEISVDAALAGVGAVGCAFLHSVWASDGLQGRLVLADNDKQGVEGTNLNRYVLFGAAVLGDFKASAAAKIISDAAITWYPNDIGIESLPSLPPRVVSAVDRNTSRHAIQNRYPARILSASTLDLRAEVVRCGPPGKGACLRCYNPPERVPADEELRERLRHASDDQLAKLVQAAGISVADAKEWIRTGRCGIGGERLFPLLRTTDEPHAFAVGFVSVMAGTMLAAEFIKDHLPTEGPLSESSQRAAFQFHLPLASSNRASAYARDTACPMCDPTTIACAKWARRFEQLRPVRR